jgi:hypothetical protein
MLFDFLDIASSIASTAFSVGKEITKGAGKVFEEVAINAGKGVAIGAGIGATVAGANLVMKSIETEPDEVMPDDDDELDRLIELLKEQRYRRGRKYRY